MSAGRHTVTRRIRTLLLAALLCVIAGVAWAQGPNGRGYGPGAPVGLAPDGKNATSAAMNDILNAAGGAMTSANHVIQNVDVLGSGGQVITEVFNTDATTGQACDTWATGTTNSSVFFCLLNNSGSPITLFSTGSAVGATLWRATEFNFQTQGGTSEVDIVPGSQTNFVHGIKGNSIAGVTCAGTPTSSFASTLGIVTHC